MKKYLIPLALALAFFIAGLFTLGDYGINWDAPFRMMRGEIYLKVFLNEVGDHREFWNRESPILIEPDEYMSRYDFLDGEGAKLLDIPPRPLRKLQLETLITQYGRRISMYEHDMINKKYFFDYFLPGHPPLTDILAALSNRVFYEKLNVLSDLDSYKFSYVLLSAVGVFVVSVFALEITGSYLAALIAGLALGLNPLYFAEAHFNMKDPIEAAFFAGSIWAFWHFIKSGSKKWFAAFVTFVVLDVNIKWNIVFLPFIILPWLFFIRKTEQFKKFFQFKKILILSLSLILTVIVSMIAISPNSWGNPIGLLGSSVNYYWNLGTQAQSFQPKGFILPFGFNLYPTLLLLFQTPEVILALVGLGVIGVIREIRGDRLKTGYLLILWLIVPVIRISLPHIWFYNGLRQIMEVMPALAVLAGIGAAWLSQKLGRLGKAGVLGGILILLLMPIYQLHPNENMYFNNFVGGLKGAVDHGLVDKKISYGNIYKQAADWLNQNAEKNANVAHLDGPMFALSPQLLRDDISLTPFYFSGFDQKGEYILNLYDPDNQAIFAQRYPKIALNPIHQISVDGVPMLTIYKNSPQFSKVDTSKEKTATDFKIRPAQSSRGTYLELDLGSQKTVSGILVKNPLPSCRGVFAPFIDEFVEFDSGGKYGLQERMKLASGEVRFSFPLEKTRFIKIYPQDSASCFTSGIITGISFF